MTNLSNAALAKLLQISVQTDVVLTSEEKDVLFFENTLVRCKNPLVPAWTLSHDGQIVVNAMLATSKTTLESFVVA